MTLDEQIRSPDQHNPLVPLALGLIAWSRKLDDLLEPRRPEASPLSTMDEDDPLILLVLGLLSVRRTLHRWLDEVAPEQPTDEDAGAGEQHILPRDLTR